jgi:hypothetical protein
LRSANAKHSLVRELEQSLVATDHDLRVPESYMDYFSGVQVNSYGSRSPDDEFFSRLERQVVTDTFTRAVTDNQVPRNQLVEVPFFLCGGGSRMKYYGALKQRLELSNKVFGISAIGKPLVAPGNLEVKGVGGDYDRLSVAYGLGWLDPGWVVETEPMGRVDGPDPTWRGNFVDKDQM